MSGTVRGGDVMNISRLVVMSVLLSLLTAGVKPVLPKEQEIVQNGIVYVPAYSSILHGDLKRVFNLSITLSIHNTDMENRIIIDSIAYYNTSGRLIHRYVDNKKITLKPLETYNLGIKETDERGGVGANFIVRWHAPSTVNMPIIETVMIGTRGQQGISFTSRGVAVGD